MKKGEKMTEEQKKKIGEANKKSLMGKHSSLKTEFKKGMTPWNKGRAGSYNTKPHTQETKEKIRLGNLGKKVGSIGYWRGKKRPNLWKGGKIRKSWWTNQRRLKKIGNGGSHTYEEWELLKAQYNWTCPCCGRKEPDIKLTIDHIVAVTKGGSDNIENIQPLCGRCNSSKQTKEIKYDKNF